MQTWWFSSHGRELKTTGMDVRKQPEVRHKIRGFGGKVPWENPTLRRRVSKKTETE